MKKCKRGHDKTPENMYTNSTCKTCHDMLKRTGKPRGRQPLAEGEASFKRLFENYRRGAERRDLPFELTECLFRFLTKGNCVYCGVEPSQTYYLSTGSGTFSTPYVYNGIDRVNNDVGYVDSNVVSCCKQCNQAKLSLPLEQFLAWIKRLVAFQNTERPD